MRKKSKANTVTRDGCYNGQRNTRLGVQLGGLYRTLISNITWNITSSCLSQFFHQNVCKSVLYPSITFAPTQLAVTESRSVFSPNNILSSCKYGHSIGPFFILFRQQTCQLLNIDRTYTFKMTSKLFSGQLNFEYLFLESGKVDIDQYNTDVTKCQHRKSRAFRRPDCILLQSCKLQVNWSL